jgi:hypothetical protein
MSDEISARAKGIWIYLGINSTDVTSPYNLAIVFMGTQREKIMGSEGAFYVFDYGRWNFWTF